MSWIVAEWADTRLEVPPRRFGGIIFDCDGTLVDSMPIHYLCWVDALRHHHAPFAFTEETFYGLAGIREQDAVRILNERHGSQVDPEGVAEFKFELFKQRFEEVQPVLPVAELARGAHARGVPIAVASGSEEVTVRGCLTATGLLPLFEVLITPRLVERGKPAPDMFLLAAERLGVAPEECLVIEDGQSGLDAAQAAGMSAVFVPRQLR
jgi:HAD superfamily hydrolase (TIGR01509 family)